MIFSNLWSQVYCRDGDELLILVEDLINKGLTAGGKILLCSPSRLKKSLSGKYSDVVNRRLFFMAPNEYHAFFLGRVRSNAMALIEQAVAEGRSGVVFIECDGDCGKDLTAGAFRPLQEALMAAIAGLPICVFSFRLLLREGHPRKALVPLDGAIILERAGRRVMIRGREVRLSPLEFKLLLFLAHHQGKVFHRRQLLRAVWGHSFGEETVAAHIYRLRRKIEADPRHPRLIQNVRGIGYRFSPETVVVQNDMRRPN